MNHLRLQVGVSNIESLGLFLLYFVIMLEKVNLDPHRLGLNGHPREFSDNSKL